MAPVLDELKRIVSKTPLAKFEHVLDGAKDNIEALGILRATGTLDRARMMALAKHIRQSGSGSSAMVAANADLTPNAVAVYDADGEMTWAELHKQVNAVAHHFKQLGVTAGDGVALLVRNSRWFVIADCAASRCGARIIYMNTGFAGPQFAEVLDREGAVLVVADSEFDAVVDPGLGDRPKLTAHFEGDRPEASLATAAAAGPFTDHPKPAKAGGQIILTSGTTGTPKGTSRGELKPDLVTMASIFSKIPHRSGQTMFIAAPLFHAWGLGNFTIAFGLGSSIVLRRRFDPEETVRLVADHKCDSLAVVPVMLQRMLTIDASVRDSLDISNLKIVAASGSALPGSLATEWMDAFGDNLYNSYGSTEVAIATIATPDDMRKAPGTAGSAPLGSVFKIFDDNDNEITEPNVSGRIFVGNRIQFEGYTGGGSKPTLGGLMSIGDLGHVDDEGRLFVGGRDDDMIISGGENLFPREVEDLLFDHDDVADAAVIGVDDPEFGQRLRAFVVSTPGASVDEATLKAYVKQNLANYKVPREIVFLDELPRNQSGKVLKRQLRDIAI